VDPQETPAAPPVAQSQSVKATDEQILAALHRHAGSRVKAATEFGITVRAFASRIAKLKAKGREVPESGYNAPTVTGTSTLYGADGETRLTWVKERTDEKQREERLDAAAKALAAKLPRVAAAPPPKSVAAALCNLYTLTDCHVGMLAWGRETGGTDWDLRIAEKVLTQCFLEMIATAPQAAVGIVNQLGDLLHFDSLVPETPTSRHILDADGRFPKVVEAAVRILRRVVDAALKRHATVMVYMHEGNHDPAASVWLRTLFAALYENEPRVTVGNTPEVYVAYRHGKTMIGFHHGHMAKNQSLPLLFAAKFPDIWGATTAGRYIHVGHRHHVDEKEHPGVIVVQHPTLAAPDAYAARGGWLSKRQAVGITYHAEFGEVRRTTVVPEMLEAA
jgi:hypothetical protein